MAKYYDYIIVGAGPAGLQMAFFLENRGKNYVILERSDRAGEFFRQFPRRRLLISINKKYTGYEDPEARLRFDWNSLLDKANNAKFTDYTGKYFPDADVLVEYCNDYARNNNLKIDFNCSVVDIRKEKEKFLINTADNRRYVCGTLFMGTGMSQENIPDIEGREFCETYATASVNPQDYRDKRVLIVGKGNSAFETADTLIPTTRKIQVCGKDPVKLAWATHYVGDLRALNNNFLDTYLLKSQNNVLDGDLVQVKKKNNELLATIYFESRKQSYDFPCDNVIFCTGFKFCNKLFADSCQPDMTDCGRLPKMNADWQSTNIKNLYFIGTTMQMRDRKKTMSGFIHGFRHNIKALDQILFAQSVWDDGETLPYDAKKILDKVLHRISRAAGIFLQPGFLCDLFWLDPVNDRIDYWHDVPKEYAIDNKIADNALMVTLEYKVCDEHMNPLTMPRGVGVEEDFYLHPVIREYRHGECVNRYFLMDDLDNDWLILPEHRQKMTTIIKRLFNEHCKEEQGVMEYVA